MSRHIVTKKTAHYRDELKQKYSGNPLVEAMPAFMNKQAFNDRIEKSVPLPEDFFSSPRMDALDDVLELEKSFFSLPQCYLLYEMIYSLVRRYYGEVNPLSAHTVAMTHDLAYHLKAGKHWELSADDLDDDGEGESQSILISGQSGLGKSRSVRRLFKLFFDQVTMHKGYKGKPFITEQVFYISIDMANSKSKTALALAFFAELDRVLGYKASEDSLSSSLKPFQYLNAMQLACLKHHIGVIHIDEMQYILNRPKSAKKDRENDLPTLPELEALFNQVGVPIIVSTTSEALNQFYNNLKLPNAEATPLQLSSRLSSACHITFHLWQRNTKYVDKFFEVFFPDTVFKGELAIDEAFKRHFLILCAGVIKAMVFLAVSFLRSLHAKLSGQGMKQNEALTDFLNNVYKTRFATLDSSLKDSLKIYVIGPSPVTESGQDTGDGSPKNNTDDEAFGVAKEVEQTKTKNPRTTKRQPKEAHHIERIVEGEEHIDADSIVLTYEKGQARV
jgi:hypothetical protein